MLALLCMVVVFGSVGCGGGSGSVKTRHSGDHRRRLYVHGVGKRFNQLEDFHFDEHYDHYAVARTVPRLADRS